LPNLSLDIPWLATPVEPHAKNKLDKELSRPKQKQQNQNKIKITWLVLI